MVAGGRSVARPPVQRRCGSASRKDARARPAPYVQPSGTPFRGAGPFWPQTGGHGDAHSRKAKKQPSRSNPNGVVQQSPGLARRQPWVIARQRPSTPTGLWPRGGKTSRLRSLPAKTPLGLMAPSSPLPRVVPAVQPWAVLRNRVPVGAAHHLCSPPLSLTRMGGAVTSGWQPSGLPRAAAPGLGGGTDKVRPARPKRPEAPRTDEKKRTRKGRVSAAGQGKARRSAAQARPPRQAEWERGSFPPPMRSERMGGRNDKIPHRARESTTPFQSNDNVRA